MRQLSARQRHQATNPWVVGTQCSRRPLCPYASKQTWTTVEQPRAVKRSMPYISFSQSKRDVTAMDVALLLQAAKDPNQSRGSKAKQGHFRHWDVPADDYLNERMLHKLTRAIDRSVALVAAFTNSDVYESPTQPSQLPTSSESVDGGGGVPNWNWSMQSSNRRHRKRSLIGFVRAAGDASLAVTIYDLAVHPEFRRYGIGTKLLRVLTQQLYYKEVYDIGSVVPREAESFFRRCSFEEDREDSMTLTFTAHHHWRDQGQVQGMVPGQDGWLMDPAWLPAPGSLGDRAATAQPRRPRITADSAPNSQFAERHAMDATGSGPGMGQAGETGVAGQGDTGGVERWEGWCDGEAAPVRDCLEWVSAPATESLRDNQGLIRILEDKLEQACPRS